MSNKVVPISDLGEIITGKTPSSNNPEDFGNEVLFITPSDDFDHKYIRTTARYLSSNGVEKLKSKLLPSESVMVTCIGSDMGKLAMNGLPAITNQQINSIVVDKSKYDPSYVYYKLIKSYEVLRQYSTGSTAIPLLNKTDFSNIEITVEDNLSTQQKIAAVLSALDAKIELNARINAELESMAKTLYDYWFVQFAPHKSAGGKMVWNEALKREIPLGWEVVELGSVCDIYQPKTISEKEMISDGNYLVFGANGIVGRYDKFNHTESEIVITCRGASCGNILRTRPNSWITGNAMVIHPTSKSMSSEFIFQTLAWLDIRKVITGSAQPQITRTNLAPLKLIIPPNEILEKFNEFCKPNVEKRLSILSENDQITELRDWLLPMLMNGQVTVG